MAPGLYGPRSLFAPIHNEGDNIKIRQSSLAILAALALPAAAQAEEVLLKIHHFLPPTGTFQSKVIEPWCEKLGVESKGLIKCQTYPSMQLGGTPPQLLGQARDGIADVVWPLRLPSAAPDLGDGAERPRQRR